MVATSRAIDASIAETVALDRSVFNRLCAAKGANTEAERAALAGVDRGTLRRWFNGTHAPHLLLALTVARNLGGTIDELWPVKP